VAVAKQSEPEVAEAQAYEIQDQDGTVLAQKNADVEMPMASITKIMSAIVALDSGKSLDDVVTLDQDLTFEEGAQLIGLKKGETKQFTIDMPTQSYAMTATLAGKTSQINFDIEVLDILDGFKEGNLLTGSGRFRIGGEHAVSTGKVDVEISLDEVEQKAGKLVVVAELQLLHGHGVVLVDDGNDAPVQQVHERVAGVQEAAAAPQVIAGEQDLSADHALGGESVLILAHEAALTDGGQRLLAGNALDRASAACDGSAACGHSAGTHEAYAMTGRGKAGQLFHEIIENGKMQALLRGEHGTANLHDDSAGRSQRSLTSFHYSRVQMTSISGNSSSTTTSS
jgi:hypothetical protein